MSRKPKLYFAHIDPEGRVSATLSTWFIIAGAVVWLTTIYVEFRSVSPRLDKLAEQVDANRDAIMRAGLFDHRISMTPYTPPPYPAPAPQKPVLPPTNTSVPYRDNP